MNTSHQFMLLVPEDLKSICASVFSARWKNDMELSCFLILGHTAVIFAKVNTLVRWDNDCILEDHMFNV